MISLEKCEWTGVDLREAFLWIRSKGEEFADAVQVARRAFAAGDGRSACCHWEERERERGRDRSEYRFVSPLENSQRRGRIKAKKRKQAFDKVERDPLPFLFPLIRILESDRRSRILCFVYFVSLPPSRTPCPLRAGSIFAALCQHRRGGAGWAAQRCPNKLFVFGSSGSAASSQTEGRVTE